MKGIILAAGRGSRMSGLTEDKPKCLNVIAGKPLLFWQLEALDRAGVDDLAVVCGYRSETIAALVDAAPVRFDVLTNPCWAETNMLSTLYCAADWAVGGECVVSYSDILYPADHVRALMAAAQPLAITYDTEWEDLWRLRQEDPLTDAETFRQEGGRLLEIGAKPESLDQVQGQYMGLIKIDPEGWRVMRRRREELGERLNKTDMTSFLGGLLSEGVEIGAVAVAGRWCEVDSEKDLRAYEAALETGTWGHDWRD
jgi:choline kinase